MRVTNERVKELMQSNTVTISSVADIRDLCHDIFESRETIEKQEAIINEMRKVLKHVQYEYDSYFQDIDSNDIDAILEKTKKCTE